MHKIEFSKRCNTKGRTKKKHLKKLLQQSSFYSLCIETINLFGDDSTAFIDILKHICLSSLKTVWVEMLPKVEFFILMSAMNVHLIFDMLKSPLNLKSSFSFKVSTEKKSDLKEYKSLLLSFEALSLLG